MELKGLNAEGEFFDEGSVSVKTLIDNLKNNPYLKRHNLEDYYKFIEELYSEIFSSEPQKAEQPIISAGTLLHFSPITDAKTGEVYYDKLKSIAKNGLLPVDMLVPSPDATDPTYVSFHSVLEGEKTLKDVQKRIQQGSTNLCFIVNTDNPVVSKLKSLGRSNGESYDPLTLEELLVQGSKTEILKKMFTLGNIFCPDNINQKGVCYLPIGVPASYISAIVVPSELLSDEKLMSILAENFANATILDKNQNKIARNGEIIERF